LGEDLGFAAVPAKGTGLLACLGFGLGAGAVNRTGFETFCFLSWGAWPSTWPVTAIAHAKRIERDGFILLFKL